MLIAAKEKTGQPWQIWEVPLAGGTPRQVTFGAEDSILLFYAAEQKLVYARKTARGFQIEIAPLAGGSALRLTYLAGNFLPDAILRDGRVLFEAAFRRRFRSHRRRFGTCTRYTRTVRAWKRGGAIMGRTGTRRRNWCRGTTSSRPARGWRGSLRRAPGNWSWRCRRGNTWVR